MMPEFSFLGGSTVRTVGVVSGTSSLGTQLTANASANTKGTYVELTAATEFDTAWVLVLLSDVSAQARYFVDIGIGAATEQVVIPDLSTVPRGAGGGSAAYLFPLFIPKGSRIAARCQSSTGGATIRCSVTLFSCQFAGASPAWVSGYGATASTQGTNVDPGASANTDSAWVELTAATDRAHNWLCVAAECGDAALAASTHWRLSIGIGAATEAVLIPDIHLSADNTSDYPHTPIICLPCFVPAGSRLTAKARCSVTTDADRDLFIRVYGAG